MRTSTETVPWTKPDAEQETIHGSKRKRFVQSHRSLSIDCTGWKLSIREFVKLACIFSSCHGNVYACFVNAFCARRSSINLSSFLNLYVDVSHRSSVPTKRRALYLENIYIRHAEEHYVTRIILLARVAPRLQHFRPGSPLSFYSRCTSRAKCVKDEHTVALQSLLGPLMPST